MFIGLVLVFTFTPIVNANEKNILITEVQTGTEASASQEFVEIYNNGTIDKDISGWTMYYKSASGTTWTKKATVVSKIIVPGGFYLFSANLPGDTSYSSTLSQAGGNIQIRDKSGVIVDQFGWGSANSALTQAASLADAGQSMYRIYDFENKTMQNTDNNFDDFEIANIPTASKLPDLILPEPEAELIDYPKIELSELFPDPAEPLTDSADEFIELFNPNAQEINLSGWKLRDESGTEYLIKDKIILGNSRLAIMVNESKITLNNTGDSITLINPNGEIVDESTNYGDAQEGLSWIKVNGQWYWSLTPTPNSPNAEIYQETETSPAQAVKNVKKASKKVTAKKATAKKPKVSKVKASPSKSSSAVPIKESLKSKNSNLWTWLLVAAGVATISYGIYEYRTEIQLQLKKLRSKFGSRS